MPARRNADVIRAFINHQPATRPALRSDGTRLYSYDLCIAIHTPSGRTIVGDYTASGEFHSVTTSKHVGMVRGGGYETLSPDQFEMVSRYLR